MLHCVGHRVPLAPVGTMGPFWSGDSPFWAAGERGLVGCVQGRELGACLPRFIVLRSFSGTILVVSTLDIVYDFRNMPFVAAFAAQKGLIKQR